jgi:hypothetical protein
MKHLSPRELRGKYAIKIVIQHAQAWNKEENGGENLCYIFSRQHKSMKINA